MRSASLRAVMIVYVTQIFVSPKINSIMDNSIMVRVQFHNEVRGINFRSDEI